MTISYSQVGAITHDYVSKQLADNVYKSAAALRRLYAKREKVDGGNNIGGPVISGAVDSTTGGWYSGLATLTEAQKDDITRAVVNWKQVYESVVLSKFEINQNAGAAQILSLIASKTKIAEKRFKSRLSGGIYSDGSDTSKFNGLDEIIHATGSYAGLAYTDILDEDGNNAWLGRVVDNSGTDRVLSGPLIQRAMGLASEDEDCPTVAFFQQKVRDELWAILDPHQRIMVEGADMSGAGHDQKGKPALMYNGIPFLIDSHASSKRIYFINEDYLKLIVHPNEDMKAESFSQLESVNGIKERMLLMGNLFCQARRFQAVLKDISVAA